MMSKGGPSPNDCLNNFMPQNYTVLPNIYLATESELRESVENVFFARITESSNPFLLCLVSVLRVLSLPQALGPERNKNDQE